MSKIQPFSQQMAVERTSMNPINILHIFNTLMLVCSCAVLHYSCCKLLKKALMCFLCILPYKTTCIPHIYFFHLLKKNLVSFGQYKPVQEILTCSSSNVQDSCTFPISDRWLSLSIISLTIYRSNNILNSRI